MNRLSKHFTANLLAGLVALLPVGGLILTIAYIESSISSTGLTKLPFYFPGLAILLALVFIYLIGLTLTSFIGNWLWTRIDRLINNLPALGKLYVTLKQILGYGEGEQAIFQKAVLVPAHGGTGNELGLVTHNQTLENGQTQWAIFIPGSPNPTTGRLIFVAPDKVKPIEIEANEVFKTLIAVGQYDIDIK